MDNIAIAEALGVLLAFIIAPILLRILPKQECEVEKELSERFLMHSKTEYVINRSTAGLPRVHYHD